jgi:Flp pilus assembly protein TadD
LPCWILGQVRQQQGDEEGARRYWEEAVARDPAFVAALVELGRLALLRQELEEALMWLRRAHEASPTDNGAVQALAATYRLLGREDDAVQLLAKNPPGSFSREARQ